MHADLVYDHVFLDAEGTLWVPRPGHDTDEFWEDPRFENGLRIFRPADHVHETLDALRRRGARIVVVSKHHKPLLHGLLDLFGISSRVDDVLVNGDKGERVVAWLRAAGVDRARAVMVGDRHDLDIAPLERCGIRAVLVDRPDNQDVHAERIADLRAIVPLVSRPQHATMAVAQAFDSCGTPSSSPS